MTGCVRVVPIGADVFQKMHPIHTEGGWVDCSLNDFIFWEERDAWKTRALTICDPSRPGLEQLNEWERSGELKARAFGALREQELEIASLKAKILKHKAVKTDLLDALMGMLVQHCTALGSDYIDDGALSANEDAVTVLEEAGLVKDNFLLWDALEARKRQNAPSAEAPGAGGS